MSSTDGRIPLFERDGFIVCFEALDEMDSVRDHYKRTGMDKKQIDALARKLGSGKAVWFQAVVSAWKGGEQLGEASLGGCYYASFEEFYTTEGDYFDGLANQAIQEAKERLGNSEPKSKFNPIEQGVIQGYRSYYKDHASSDDDVLRMALEKLKEAERKQE